MSNPTQDPSGLLGANDCRRQYYPITKFAAYMQILSYPVGENEKSCQALGDPLSRFVTGRNLFLKADRRTK